MNVLFQIRNDYKESIAGDSIQMQKTKEYLEKIGVQVDIATNNYINLEKYDIIHIFNLIRIKESYRFAQNARKQGKPYVLSTIYWNMADYIKNDKNTSATIKWWLKDNDLRKEVLEYASILLPNSSIEADVLKKDFSINKECFIIPNCADSFFNNANPDNFILKYGLTDFVLCVGRISCRKNQLALINALKDTGLNLVLIGPNNNEGYYKQCKLAAGNNVIFIDQLPDYEIASAYAAAKVHVLPSWYETPGLASLEAGLVGCNIVSTKIGSALEYFEKNALYCDPASEESIRESVKMAFCKPKGEILKNHIFNNYTWEVAAIKTLDAYKTVLKTNVSQ
ncbi:MAG: glycosyltransferase family 4 protein [Aminipila sp.]